MNMDCKFSVENLGRKPGQPVKFECNPKPEDKEKIGPNTKFEPMVVERSKPGTAKPATKPAKRVDTTGPNALLGADRYVATEHPMIHVPKAPE